MGTDTIFYSEHKLDQTEIHSLDEIQNEKFSLGIGVGNKTYYQSEIEKYGGKLWSWEVPPTDKNLKEIESNISGPEGGSVYVSKNMLITYSSVRWREFLNKPLWNYVTIALSINPSIDLIIAAPDYSIDLLEEYETIDMEQLANHFNENDVEFIKYINK